MYRSFITCDDPKGVVECRPIRKSKSGSQTMESTVVSRRSQMNSNASSTYKEESHMVSKGITKEIQNPSSFQLMEVSKGAQNLNRVIDSWSDGMTFDGNSEDIAKDLLKGALDLQDSLIMLGKLQEASCHMAHLKKKQEKSRKGRIGEMGSERTNYDQFGDKKCQMGIQKPRLSADSRDCFEELRQVIRDSLARQNLLPNSSTEEEASFSRNTSVSARDTPSTSSGQSSTVHSHESAASFDCPLSSKTQQKKPNGPNLIAKLMGLEEIPSKQLQSTPQKQSESDKTSNHRRPIFDIDKPKTVKPSFVVQKVDPARRTLKEILETVKFEGLLRSSSLEGFKPSSRHPTNLPSKKRSIDDAPPIVIMRPSRSCLAAEEPCTQMYFQEEGALDTKEMLRNLKIKKVVSKRVLNSHEKCKDLEAEETPIERLIQEDKVKDCKEVLAKPEEREVNSKAKRSSNKLKASIPVNRKAHKEAIEKQVDKIQKVTHTGRKPVEVENLKSKGMSQSHDHAKMASTKLKGPEKGLNITKNRIAQKKGTASNLDSKHPTPTTSRISTDWKKNPRNVKPVREPTSANFAAETIGCWDDTKGINSMPKDNSDLIRTDTVPAEGMDASVIQVKDYCNNSQHALCEVRLQTIQHETGIKFAEEDQCNNCQHDICELGLQTIQHKSSIESAEEANDCISHNSTEKKFFKTEKDPRDLLLKSPSFLSHAEELFCISAHQPIQTASVNDSRTADTKLLLDCANEFMELKSLQCTQTVHSLLQIPMQSSRTCISLDQLVGEVCNGIEDLRCYCKLADENLPIDSIFAVMDRDLRCKEASGAWDWGWRNGFTVDEVKQVTDDIEKFILSCLIEEVLTDVVL